MTIKYEWNRRLAMACATLMAMALAMSSGFGAVLATYDFSTSDALPASSDANVSAGSFLPVGPGLDPDAGWSGSGNMYARSQSTADNITNSITADDYLSVTMGKKENPK